ncbi:Cupredoxin [Xylariomycetidae sp. FL2044]|nr:Cupredoxin [Xylariomycetidae sp. FL2044]
MKTTAVLSLALAPLAFAKGTHNAYPVHRRNGHLAGVGGAAVGAVPLVQGVGVGSTQVIVIWANPGNNAETTTLAEQVTVTQTVTAGAAATTVAGGVVQGGETATVVGAGATHTVTVGGAAGLVFTPAETAAAVGDMVIFEFQQQNHTATQSTFAAPCDPMEGGMDTGFQANPNNTISPAPQVAMQVMTAEPIWFYCKQANHCGMGMTFSINPTAEKTQAMFQAMAIAQKGAGAGSAITGNATETVATSAAGAAATEAPAAVSTGTGAIQGGACVCAVTCGVGSFPAVEAQGLGAFGGMAGALPASMMETV